MSKTPTRKSSLTVALEDYLETVYELVRDRKFARVKDVAKARGVKSGSVSPALKRLAGLGLVKYVHREYIELTPDGEEEARRIYAKHQLLASFFVNVLQIPSKSAQAEACTLEHGLSYDTMNRLVRFLEFLEATSEENRDFLARFHKYLLENCTTRPHEISHEEEEVLSVYDLKPGQRGKVTKVNARGAIRQRLLDMGILPGTLIEIERLAPTGDPIWVKLDGFQVALRRKEAQAVLLGEDT
jgi:DtxR family Mn-dependent transcriptional regulator